MGKPALSLVVLKTRQIGRLRGFYETLGINWKEERHGQGPAHFAGQIGEVVFELYPLPDDGTPADATTRLGFAVEKVNVVFQALQNLGAPVVNGPAATQWGVRAVVRDPDGRAVELYESNI